ncbi:Lrp/AsnC family transcriptional regulator [Desulfoferula mesophila]|uniref:Transcriptional regulator n=1 Tax=Desulfoferula mesophila TaxID=3058419 RepID=A0AAU9EL97_9BACT|nr:transcriptional regulator [Desulfoferula mesophilus]
MKLDDINLMLVRHLREGRKSLGVIAKALGITTNTVRSRLAKLDQDGVLTIRGLVNPDQIDGHMLVVIGIKLATPRLVDGAEKFNQLKGVASVVVVTGRFDLLVTVLLNDQFGLTEFYAEEVSKIDEVLSTETFVVYKNLNCHVPYVL